MSDYSTQEIRRYALDCALRMIPSASAEQLVQRAAQIEGFILNGAGAAKTKRAKARA